MSAHAELDLCAAIQWKTVRRIESQRKQVAKLLAAGNDVGASAMSDLLLDLYATMMPNQERIPCPTRNQR